MSALASTQAGPPLLFNWEGPRRRKLAIAGFVAGSVLAHAGCFYLFQIIYPPTIALLPAPARVTLLTPSSEEGRTLLRWVEAEDPALASSTQRSPEAKNYTLPKVEHVPSYVGHIPALQEPPPLTADLSIPSAHPLGAVSLPQPKRAQPVQPAPTSILFSKEIEDLGPPQSPSIKFSGSTGEPPEAARFRIAVSRSGEIVYCFPLNSSGDRALDEQAREYLVLSRFPAKAPFSAAASGDLTWGIATVAWGNDIARAPGRSTVSPSP